MVIFPGFHGHRVNSPSPLLRSRRGNDSRESSAGGLGYFGGGSMVSDTAVACMVTSGLLSVSGRSGASKV